ICKSIAEPAHTSRRLPSTVQNDAFVFLPEFVLIQSVPNCTLFNQKNEVCRAFLELDHMIFNNAGNAPAAGADGTRVDRIAGIDECNLSCQLSLVVSKEVEFFADKVRCDFKVFDDHVGLILSSKCKFFGTRDWTFRHVEHIADTG